MKLYYNHNKDLKMIATMYILNTEQINNAVIMIRDYKYLIKLQYIRMEPMHSKYDKVRC